ncbi:MAG TPA: hypothetical protein PLD46_09820 [Hyphomicrobium sp.]|nr:hypothetical protein [Hyphomicrobium sp.]
MVGTTQKGGGANPERGDERAERLMYLADLLKELQDISAREGCVTLASLLALSHTEALNRIRDC